MKHIPVLLNKTIVLNCFYPHSGNFKIGDEITTPIMVKIRGKIIKQHQEKIYHNDKITIVDQIELTAILLGQHK